MRTEDGSIIHECLNGKPEAFGVLVDKYKTGIYAFVYAQLRNFEDAQDVTQEAFIQAYQDLRSLRRWESFAFWLYRIASTRCKKWLRARSRRPDSEFIEDQDPIVLDEHSLDAYRDSQIDKSLQEALDSLPEAYREVLLLHYFGGMTSKDISRALGTSPAAILQRLTRGRAQLKEEILGMMSKTFKQRRLPVAFTFRIVEAAKRVGIQPMPRMSALPWGLSLTAGVIIAVLGLNPDTSRLAGVAIPDGSMLPVEAQVLKSGEIPVDVLKITNMTAISNRQGNGEGGELKPPNLQNTLFVALQGGDTWTKRADMPTARSSLGVGVVNGRIYAIGGMDLLREGGMAKKIQTIAAVEEYDPATDTWTKKADMPTAKRAFGVGVVNGKIYVIGGDNNVDLLSTVEEYDPVTDKWTRKSDMPTKRASFGTCVVNGKIYTIGGGTWDSPFLNFSTVEEYDPVADKWAEKTNMPTARLDLSACAANGKIYAIGGMTHWENLGNAIVEEYDPATDTWARKANMPTIRRGFAAVSVNEKIYAIGGVTDQIPFPPLSNIEEYDPTTDGWAKKTDMPTSRMFPGAGAVNGRIYVIGGTDGKEVFHPIVEEYNTGFSGKNVDLKGKLPTKWGEVRTMLPPLRQGSWRIR